MPFDSMLSMIMSLISKNLLPISELKLFLVNAFRSSLS